MAEEQKELDIEIPEQENMDDLIAEVLEEDQNSDLEGLLQRHEELSKQVAALHEHIASLAVHLENHESLSRLLDDLGNQCRDLREQQHEREMILPLVCVLIAIADRCSGQIKELQERIVKNSKGSSTSGLKAVRCIVKSRQADLTELGEALANLGVERYETPEDTFNPEMQTPLQRIKSETPELHLRIAERLLPGYKRYERIVRKERVAVYVNHASQEEHHGPRN